MHNSCHALRTVINGSCLRLSLFLLVCTLSFQKISALLKNEVQLLCTILEGLRRL